MKHLFTILFFILLSTFAHAQEQYLFYLNKGKAQFKSANYEGALKNFEAAEISENANVKEIRMWINITNQAKSNPKEAKNKHLKNSSLNPSHDSFYYLNRGFDKYNLKNYLGALNDFTKAIELNPNDSTSYFWRGLTKYNLNNYKDAIDDYTKAIELNPNDADSYLNRGSAKDNLNDFLGAMDDYNSAIRLNPNDADSYYGRGLVKDKLKNYTGSISDFNTAIQLNPNNANFYNGRGFVKSETNDKVGACSDFKKSCDLGNNIACTNYENDCKALEQLDENAWYSAKSKNTLTAYKNYTSSYPNGKYFDEATIRIEVLLNTLPEGSLVGGGKFLFSIGNHAKVVTTEDLGAFSWNEAKALAVTYRGGGYSDWKLIDTIDLKFLYEEKNRCSCFSYFSNDFYWSSNELNDDNAYFVNFENGRRSSGLKDNKFHVILSRFAF